MIALLLTVSTSGGAQQKVLLGHATTSTVSIRLFAAVRKISVEGWDRDSVELSGVIAKEARAEMNVGSPSGAPKGMKMFVEAETDQAGREGNLLLRVPRNARVWVKTGSADLEVTGIRGGLDLNVVGGSITVHGSPHDVRAESMDGDVIIDGAPEWLRAKTATGDITLHGGQDIGAATISGAIRTVGGEVERAKLEATTGAISFASAVARGASVEIDTHSGPVEIVLASGSAADLDVSTITGTIDNRFTLNRPNAGSEGRGMTLTSSSGMGGGRIVVRSFKGMVQLKTR